MNWTIEEGMPLRDYFAAKAMQGELASQPHIPCNDWYDSDEEIDALAGWSYRIADAMLRARLPVSEAQSSGSENNG